MWFSARIRQGDAAARDGDVGIECVAAMRAVPPVTDARDGHDSRRVTELLAKPGYVYGDHSAFEIDPGIIAVRHS